MWAAVTLLRQGRLTQATPWVLGANPGALLWFFFSNGQANDCRGSEDGFVSVAEATWCKSA